MSQEFTSWPSWSAWPFWMLEITPDAKGSDIEKAARTIMARIEFGVDDANRFLTPVGIFQRDKQIIAEAKSTLQDPSKRLLAEFWYISPDHGNTENDKESKLEHKSTSDWLNSFSLKIL